VIFVNFVVKSFPVFRNLDAHLKSEKELFPLRALRTTTGRNPQILRRFSSG
jgi:hypothetical protein